MEKGEGKQKKGGIVVEEKEGAREEEKWQKRSSVGKDVEKRESWYSSQN
jgi:hypothetical protein